MGQTGFMSAVGVFGMPVALLVIAALIIWDRARHRRRIDVEVFDGPEGEPYRIFTTEYDRVVQANDVPQLLRYESLDGGRGWTDLGGTGWQQILARAEESGASEGAERALRTRVEAWARINEPGIAGRIAIAFLVDQSGSMRGNPMARVRAALISVQAALAVHAIAVEILGFSTIGWHGGKAYGSWLRQGGPARPGRLSALLHIIYKSFDEPDWSDDSQKVMLHPDILRENIDGEAIRWAASRLRAAVQPVKILMVISDGAPVDDATLMHNGPSYLERDILRAIDEVECSADIRLGAVGVGFSVERYFPQSIASDLEDLPDNIINLSLALMDQAGSATATKQGRDDLKRGADVKPMGG